MPALPAAPSVPSGPGLGLGNLLAVLSNPYGLPDNAVWNLQKGSFLNAQGKTIVFFIEVKSPDPTQKNAIDQISDSGGRRLAIYEYPYTDGQAIDDLGRKGEKFSFNIKFYGSNYQILFKNFIDTVVNSSGIGTLSHPVRGVIKCRFQEYEFIHRHDEFNAVSIRATFLEDNSGEIQSSNLLPATPNSVLRSVLGAAVSGFATAQQTLFAATALLLLPNLIKTTLNNRITSLKTAVLLFLGQLAATFSNDAQLQRLYANAQASLGLGNLNSGVSGGSTLPPVYQVGLSPSEQTQINPYVNSNQVTNQQALYNANQILTNLSAAIAEANAALGNNAFDLALLYRNIAVGIQQVTQVCINNTNNTVIVYTVPSAMSLRTVAFKNGLAAERQNDIEALNPYLGSVNYVPAGSQLLVPSS